jgi:hypothetical protein
VTYSAAPNLHVIYDGGWVFRWTESSNQNQPRAMLSLSEVVMWLWNEGQGFSHEEIDAMVPHLLALRRAARRVTAASSAASPPKEQTAAAPDASAPGERVYEIEQGGDEPDIITDNDFEDP